MAEPDQPTLPYGPYNAFESFIQKLKETAVPPVVDRSTMRNLSGSGQTALITALRFLKLAQDTGHSLPSLSKLVKAFGTESWPNELADVVFAAYSDVLSGLDIDKASSKSLRDAFKSAGVTDGTPLDKSIRFFLQAAKAARVTVSPHFAERKPRTPSAPKRRNGSNAPSARSNETQGHQQNQQQPIGQPGVEREPPPAGMHSISIPLRNKRIGTITVPIDITKEDLPVIEALVGLVRAFASTNDTTNGKEESA